MYIIQEKVKLYLEYLLKKAVKYAMQFRKISTKRFKWANLQHFRVTHPLWIPDRWDFIVFSFFCLPFYYGVLEYGEDISHLHLTPDFIYIYIYVYISRTKKKGKKERKGIKNHGGISTSHSISERIFSGAWVGGQTFALISVLVILGALMMPASSLWL